MNDITWPRVKKVSPGDLLFVRCCSLSMSGVLSEFLLRISDIDVKYLFTKSTSFIRARMLDSIYRMTLK